MQLAPVRIAAKVFGIAVANRASTDSNLIFIALFYEKMAFPTYVENAIIQKLSAAVTLGQTKK